MISTIATPDEDWLTAAGSYFWEEIYWTLPLIQAGSTALAESTTPYCSLDESSLDGRSLDEDQCAALRRQGVQKWLGAGWREEFQRLHRDQTWSAGFACAEGDPWSK